MQELCFVTLQNRLKTKEGQWGQRSVQQWCQYLKRDLRRGRERGRAVKEKVFMPWNTAPLPVRASSNKFRVNVGLGLTSAFSFTYRSFSSFWTLREPCAGVSCLLSPKLLDSKLAIMSEGFRDYILNQLNAIASVNFQNNRTAQRCHTDQGRLASASGSVTPPL